MRMKLARKVLCWGMIALVPTALMADGSGVGTVHPYGTAWLNGAAVEQSSPIFPGDLVQTNSDSALKISSSGSSVTVLSDSLVKFEGGAVSVQHGGVKLVTSKSMSARAGSVTAAPASTGWTEFEMSDVNGTVQVVALKGDLQIRNGSRTTILSQGQQAIQVDSNATQSKRGQSAAILSASAGETSNAGFILGSAMGRSADALSRSVEAVADRSVEAEKIKPKKHISPIKP